MRQAVIIDAVRTPIGRAHPEKGMFRDVRAGPLHPPTNDLAIEALGKAALGIPPDALPRWGD